MANPLRDFFFGTINPKRDLVEALTPRRSFDDVILPASTRQQLDHALNQIRKRDLIFNRWGLGERHATGQGLAFNFAGPPGTGKTICAEAIAFALGKKLLVVRYSEMESLWAGETGKNVAAVFHSASEQDAVLFFDEADAIAGRRFTHVTQGYQREANTVVNVLLKELEEFDGVVIFATNLATNFDPAFERRVRTHILFEMPGAKERAEIWKVQLHARKTPLAADVDFAALGEKYAIAGGDIKNAVLKAAQIATSEPGPDIDKKIHQRHFEQGMTEVMGAKKVMEQSLFSDGDGSHAMSALSSMNGAWQEMSRTQEGVAEQIEDLNARIGEVERQAHAFPGIVERFDDAARAAQSTLRAELIGKLDELRTQQGELRAQQGELHTQQGELRTEYHELHSQSSELAEKLRRLSDALEPLPAQIKTQGEEFHATLRELKQQVQSEGEARGALENRLNTQHTQIEKYAGELETQTSVRQQIELLWLRRWWMAMGLAVVSLLAAAGAIVTAVR
jgi:predicted  nucleic acid-binding Zn-ribbon protein